MSVSAYDPRYLDLWRDGGTRGVELKMSKSEAVAMRHRMYRLRMAMQKENHPLREVAERGNVSIRFTGEPNPTKDDWVGYSRDKQMFRVCAERKWDPAKLQWRLWIQPPDQRFDEILAEAGYAADEPPPLD